MKCAKRSMIAIIGNADFTDEKLLTTIVGGEGILNCRPLTYQTSYSNDERLLTPEHFLNGQLWGQIAQEFDAINVHPRRGRLRV